MFEKVKLDAKDLRILKELDRNPDISINKLAKNVQISQQVADYRIKNLFKNQIINKIMPIVELSKLGFSLYRVHVRFKVIRDEKKKSFEDFVFNNFKCFFMGSVGGRYDEYLDLFAESSQKFQEDLATITEKFSEIIQEYEIMEITKIHLFNYKYLGRHSNEFVTMGSSKKVKIDEKDRKILNFLKKDSRISYIDLGFKVHLSRNGVKERIKNLMRKEIILGSRMFLNSRKVGKESYKILLKMKNNVEEKERLIKFVKNSEEVIYLMEFLGKYDFDLEIEVDNRERLQEFIINLRNNFDLIDYEIVSLFYDYGIDFFPLKD